MPSSDSRWGNVDLRHGVKPGGRTSDLMAAGNEGARHHECRVRKDRRHRRSAADLAPRHTKNVADNIARILARRKRVRARRGVTLMFNGLSGSGRSTVAWGVAEWLQSSTDRSVTLVDGDVARQMLSAGLGFDRAGRVANVRRIGDVAVEVTRHGGVAIRAPNPPCAQTRAEVRAMVEAVGDFILVHANTPIEACEDET